MTPTARNWTCISHLFIWIGLSAAPATAEAQCPQPAPTFGDSTSDVSGFAMAISPDLDGDGYDDYIIARGSDVPASGAGRVDVVSGRTHAVVFSMTGTWPGEGLGWGVSAAGDLNNDGTNDFLVARVDTATVYAMSGITGDTLFEFYDPAFTTATSFGQTMAPAGDVNSDGYDDVLIGDHFWPNNGANMGRAYLFFGSDTTLNFAIPVSSADRIHTGEDSSDVYGFALSGGEDIDHDGYDDYMIGAPEFLWDTGYVHVYSGWSGSLLYRVSEGDSADYYGASVAVLADQNGDSFADFAVGASRFGGGSEGQIVVYSGATGGIIQQFTHVASGAGLARSIAQVGDINGDGRHDLAVGSNIDTAFVYDMVTGNALLAYPDPAPGGAFGFMVVGGGDLNADGYDDMLVSDYADSTLTPNGGAVYPYRLVDTDGDRIEDFCDNCPAVANPAQEDLNFNGIGDACEVPDSLSIFLFSPVHMVVTDPLGDSIGIPFNTILNGSGYDSTSDYDGDTDPDDIVTIPNPIVGDYNIRIIRDAGTPDSAKFTLAIRINGNQVLEDEEYQDVRVSELGTTVPENVTWTAAATLPGDANADGITTSADIIYLVNTVFKSGPDTVVPGHGDVNCDGVLTSSDIIYLVNYVFKGGLTPCSQTAG